MKPKCPVEQDISLGSKNVQENGMNSSMERATFESCSLWQNLGHCDASTFTLYSNVYQLIIKVILQYGQQVCKWHIKHQLIRQNNFRIFLGKSSIQSFELFIFTLQRLQIDRKIHRILKLKQNKILFSPFPPFLLKTEKL